MLDIEGFCLHRNLIDPDESARLIRVFEEIATAEGGRGGVRNLLDVPTFRELATAAKIRSVVAANLGDDALVVRGILFDKNDNANWKVPWHQDVTIAVTNKVEKAGYGPWSVKAGVMHVQPPAYVLEGMISVRIHLDDCPSENGALRVLPRTHREGKLSQKHIDQFAASVRPVVCEALAGDALIMRPLLLHASSAASRPRHRRVIHFDFAHVELADGLQWKERRDERLCKGQ